MIDIESDSAFSASNNPGSREPQNYVKFYRQWVRNNFKSAEEGREVGEERDFVLIISPGQSKTEVRRQANDNDKSTYRGEWLAYLEGKENQQTGTPIELLPGLPNGMGDALKSMYVMTIEQAAGLSDLAAQKLGMGAADIRRKAQEFMAGGNGGELKAKLAEAELTITTLRTTVAALEAKIEALESKPVARRGRKPKDLDAARMQ